MKIGRNDPCPCGSRVKYKKCCAGKQEAVEQSPGMSEVMGELRELLKGQSFGSLEEANAFLSRHMQKRSQAPIDDFHGLSPEQMHRFLHFPFNTPALISFPSPLDITPQAPIVTLFNLLVETIGDDGLKATATGNLPRNFCREAAIAFLGEEGYGEYIRYGGINSETDFSELHVTRLVVETAGLVRKYKGKFITSRECRKILAESGMQAIYPRLFRAFAREYNWGYQDRYPDFQIIQQSFLFTLYLLQRYGNDWRPGAFYS
ncbi:MAG TPA: SEC-C metal-binding domain-containing protein, partial [Geobacteraceae bacterium]|nr:SEC-C metal-binding domain-containing protein [Geobacteraceae bacterium]